MVLVIGNQGDIQNYEEKGLGVNEENDNGGQCIYYVDSPEDIVGGQVYALGGEIDYTDDDRMIIILDIGIGMKRMKINTRSLLPQPSTHR